MLISQLTSSHGFVMWDGTSLWQADGRCRPRRAGGKDILGFGEIEPTRDQGDVAGHLVNSARQIGVLTFEEADALLDLDQLGLDLRDIATDRLEMIEDQIGSFVARRMILWWNWPKRKAGRGSARW